MHLQDNETKKRLMTKIQNRPNPKEAFPNPSIPSLCFIKNVVKNPRIIIGDYTYYDDVDGADQKASGGMKDLAKVLKENNAKVDFASWSAKLPSEEQERLAEELIAKGGNINFIRWEAGSVIPESGKGMEHMASFDYGYKIAAVRDWLFRQSK